MASSPPRMLCPPLPLPGWAGLSKPSKKSPLLPHATWQGMAQAESQVRLICTETPGLGTWVMPMRSEKVRIINRFALGLGLGGEATLAREASPHGSSRAAFRPLVPPAAVWATYGVSTMYVLADTRDKVLKAQKVRETPPISGCLPRARAHRVAHITRVTAQRWGVCPASTK